MQIPTFTVDAFTDRPFSGNPAAVCLLESDLNEDVHQKIATEMNLSETAFIRKLHPGDDFTKSRCSGLQSLSVSSWSWLPPFPSASSHSFHLESELAPQGRLTGSCFGLRWFTPANEVPLCGHATLAAAAVLFHIRKNTNAVLTFVTLSGELKARRMEDHIVLDLPLYLTYPQLLQEVEDLIKAAIGDMVVQDLRYSPDTKKLLVRLSDAYERSVLEELQVNAQRFLSAEKTGKVKGLILTLKGNSSGKHKGHDFYSRYFAPWYGIPEDPVTGSAHAVLSSYWSEQLGKKEMLAFQCSRRGGELKISLRNDGRVDIAGQIAIVLKGNLTL
ncbi:phenazine biosynthesis-like domain-containing protein isoform B [Patagioenas fasciata monilis]|uniref:Phenazine biosynthesis-like domain-containing protein isoform B n=1 Tax=Patagioenas fasciata monilis TaxID=372326 RepID=A0A1V4KJU5_PATFA|nr:phenazine biosynthesis-like domain-containing protein isoform B [Patagioenas fasciata monilis]